MARLACFFCAMLLALSAGAKEAAPLSDDPVLEQRVMKLAEELRCLVCQNQTIADSHADLAVDLRNQIREKLKAGTSEADVRKFMVDRYGDFVLYRPPVKASTVLLWAGPFVLLVAGCGALFTILKRRRREQPSEALSPEEERKALDLLNAPHP
jgi:cytochrome c-type biogenesis protein CcmH